MNYESISMNRRCVFTIGTAMWLAATLLIMAAAWPTQTAAAGPVTEATVAQRVAEAKTAADHEALATYYRGQAAAKAEDVKRHEAMLKSYDNVAGVSKEIMRNHCERLIQSYGHEQKEYEGLANEHEKLAKAAGGTQ